MSDETIKAHDMAGREIRPGCFVCYAALWSRSAVLKYGRVTRLAQREPRRNSRGPQPTIRVITVDRGWVMDTTTREVTHPWQLQAKGKEITLTFPDRMVVVNSEHVPLPVQILLDPLPERTK